MMNTANAQSLYEEALKLSRNTDGNNGRAMRRFLSRASVDGQFLQVFAEADVAVDKVQLKQYKEYATNVLERLLRNIEPENPEAYRTEIVKVGSIVRNVIPMAHVIAEASVAQLYKDVWTARYLLEPLAKFAADIAGELHTVSKEYRAEQRKREVARSRQQHERFMRMFGAK